MDILNKSCFGLKKLRKMSFVRRFGTKIYTKKSKRRFKKISPTQVDVALSPDRADPSLNYFGVKASQSLAEWRKKGWIRNQDPRGWFQWYCRYYLGRRCDDDARQIKRWRAMRRHVAQVEKYCERYDLNCRPKQRQALLHWAYDLRAT